MKKFAIAALIGWMTLSAVRMGHAESDDALNGYQAKLQGLDIQTLADQEGVGALAVIGRCSLKYPAAGISAGLESVPIIGAGLKYVVAKFTGHPDHAGAVSGYDYMLTSAVLGAPAGCAVVAGFGAAVGTFGELTYDAGAALEGQSLIYTDAYKDCLYATGGVAQYVDRELTGCDAAHQRLEMIDAEWARRAKENNMTPEELTRWYQQEYASRYGQN